MYYRHYADNILWKFDVPWSDTSYGSLYDGRLGMYDHRTFVFGARTLEGLSTSAPLAILPAHAGEIYEDESGIYLLSAFHPKNGVSAVKIEFDENY